MKPVLASFLIVLAATSHAIAAPAQPVRADLPGYSGFDDCRIAPLEPAPRRGLVDWNGSCAVGFATGQGELDWKDEGGRRYRLKATLVRGEIQGEGELKTEDFTYLGTYRRGVPHGSGFFTYKSSAMYEGDVVGGKREGKGIMMHSDRTEYTGEWKDNKEHGWGEVKYALGGSYNGQWREGRRHGRGKIVYAGSGRAFEGQFHKGRIATAAPLEAEAATETSFDQDDSTGLTNYPTTDQTWDQFTEAQKNARRKFYPALEAGDDPPYPAKGFTDIIEVAGQLNAKAGFARGNLTMLVLVGADGKAKQVKVFEKPDLQAENNIDTLVERISRFMMLATYKPAMCRGQACEMVYPLCFNFD